MTRPEFIDEVNQAIGVYEKATGGFATRTRQLIDNYGAVDALSRLVLSPDLQTGFKVLRDRNELNKSFEAVIIRHSDLFIDKVIEAAHWRLDNADNLL